MRSIAGNSGGGAWGDFAAGPFGSPRILMRSGVPALRRNKGAERGVGERFSTHATVSMYGDFDEPLIPRGSVNPGTGGVVALEAGASVREAVRTLLAFNARESCGKCTPCREGTARMLGLLDPATVDAARVKALSETVQLASLCGLGQAAPLAVLSGLAEFPEQFGIINHA